MVQQSEKPAVALEMVAIDSLRPYQGNARTHSKKQVRQIAESIKKFGFTNPILIDDNDQIMAGHGRAEAAKLVGMGMVPALRLSHLNAAQRRAYVIADNKLALNAGWDRQILAIELQALIDLEFDVGATAFSMTEIDSVLYDVTTSSVDAEVGPENDSPPLAQSTEAVSRIGDLWELGRHRLLCGDNRRTETIRNLLHDERADLIFTDPPYNAPIEGHARGSGRVRHGDFAMGVGQMSPEAFTGFLQMTLGHAAEACREGAVALVCIDWRHMAELLEAGRRVFTELKNLCIWNNTSGGVGSFYANKHELIFVFTRGQALHGNIFGLGNTGLPRRNVWDYAGVDTWRTESPEKLGMHPTAKPVALVSDALLEYSKRGETVLDPFAGSGTTLVAAEKTDRRARLVEFDPYYSDQIIRRFEQITGKRASLAGNGDTFEEVAEQRASLAQQGQS